LNFWFNDIVLIGLEKSMQLIIKKQFKVNVDLLKMIFFSGFKNPNDNFIDFKMIKMK
jgi:hypothetical protein